MSPSVWSQIDSGIAIGLGVIVGTAAIRKFTHPRVIALTLERLEPALVGRRRLAIRLGLAIAAYELFVGAGVLALRGTAGFVFACALLVACAGFLAALARAVQRSVPCACFGRLGRTAAGGREIGRAIVLVLGAGILVAHRAGGSDRYGFGAVTLIAVLATVAVIVIGQRIGMTVRPGVELRPRTESEPRSFANAIRGIAGFDNDLYTIDGPDQVSGK